MTTEMLLSGVVPACVAIVMASLGLNLSLASVATTLRQPRSLLVVTLLQIVLLPALALALIAIFAPPPLVAIAIVAIAASPGGALSNAFTQLAGGNLAFSVMMTTASTLLVSATAPAILGVALATGLLEQGAATRPDPVAVAFDLLRLVLLPIGLGLLVAQALPRTARVLRRGADLVCLLAIAVVLVFTTIVSLPALGTAAIGILPYAVLFSLGSFLLGTLVSLAVPRAERSACSIEFGLRNMPIALVLVSGGTASAEVVALFLVYFLVATGLLLILAPALRRHARRVAS